MKTFLQTRQFLAAVFTYFMAFSDQQRMPHSNGLELYDIVIVGTGLREKMGQNE